jgi:hypothetical protein
MSKASCALRQQLARQKYSRGQRLNLKLRKMFKKCIASQSDSLSHKVAPQNEWSGYGLAILDQLARLAVGLGPTSSCFA